MVDLFLKTKSHAHAVTGSAVSWAWHTYRKKVFVFQGFCSDTAYNGLAGNAPNALFYMSN